jgi:hypothetical protein
MKILASIVSLTLFAATLSVPFSSPAISKDAPKGKSKASQTAGAKPTSGVKKPPCDINVDHNKAC